MAFGYEPKHADLIESSARLYCDHLRALRAGPLTGRGHAIDGLIETLEAAVQKGVSMTVSDVRFHSDEMVGWLPEESAQLINQWTLGFGSDSADVIVMGTEEAYSLEEPRDLALWNCCCAVMWLTNGNAEIAHAIDNWYQPTQLVGERPLHIHYNDWMDIERGIVDRGGVRHRSGRHTWKLVSEVAADEGQSVHDFLALGSGVMGDRLYQIEVSAHPLLHSAEGEENATSERTRFLLDLVSQFRSTAHTLLFHGRPADPSWGDRQTIAAAFLGLPPDDLALVRGQLVDDPHSYWHWRELDGRLVVFARALNGSVRGDYLDAMSDLVHRRGHEGATRQAIVIEVDGRPPMKSEALSLFGEAHPKASEVVELLRKARSALSADFLPITGSIGVELTLWAPDDRDLGDATNYLGGVADVLQARRPTTISLEHLGDLTSFAAFLDDNQIRAVRYRHIVDAHPHYRVTIWPLSA